MTMGVRGGSVWKLLLLLAVASLAAKKSFNEKFHHPKQSLATLLPRDIHGNDVRLAELEGHTYFITNVGSLHQDAENFYQQLEALQTKYGKFGLEVLVFPSHQFDDEHSSEAEITTFASKHAPSVRLMQPIRVKVRATPPFSITSGVENSTHKNKYRSRAHKVTFLYCVPNFTTGKQSVSSV